jgi:hypothetical protein
MFSEFCENTFRYCKTGKNVMINNIDAHRTQDILQKPVSKKNRAGQTTDLPSPDASIKVGYGNLIADALQLAQAREGTVERARDLIASGQLDTPENIRSAATNMLQLGI